MNWFHMLAAFEYKNAITVCLRLYNGPDHIPNPDYVSLARVHTPIILPDNEWAHVYELESQRKDKYAGRVIVPVISAINSRG